jgi:dGTPase
MKGKGDGSLGKEYYEELEKQILSEYAALSGASKGRIIPVEPDGIRTEYQRDRDRILHCNSFRRLKRKTQVFLSPQGDHYRTRLTHTLEVSQIARTIARALRLNEDLTEAIALGHDLGHTPFGHAGERALREVHSSRFSHNYQSVRVVDYIEREGRGLNLTYEVKNGIACHSDDVPWAATLEGRVVRISDKVAYINHDIEDAVRAGVLREDQLPYDCIYVLGRDKSARITTIIRSLIAHSGKEIRMADEVYEAHRKLQRFMFEEVYTNPVAKSEEGRAEGMIQTIYRYFREHPDKLPAFYRGIAERVGEAQAVCDYVAGMTDNYAVELFEELYVPKFWMK